MRLTLIVLTVITLGGTEDIARCNVENADDETLIIEFCSRKRESYQEMYFRNCQFREFPNIFLHYSNLKEVDISHSGIESIDSTIFEFSHTPLAKLAMGGNRLTRLYNSQFQHLHDLLELDVSRNKILHIKPNAFTGLTNLTRLDLSYNQIPYLDTEFFAPLIQLVSLRLANNNINYIGAHLFRHNVNLKFGYFSSNDMVSVDDTSFLTTQLSILDVQFNKLEKVNLSALTKLTKLTIANNKINLLILPPNVELLHAENNSITAIQSEKNSKLKHLFLASNKLFDLQNFTNFPELITLDLSFNNIQKIDFVAIKDLTHLQELHFIGMKLSQFDPNVVLKMLPNLKMIALSKAQWSEEIVATLETELLKHRIILVQDKSTMDDTKTKTSTTNEDRIISEIEEQEIKHKIMTYALIVLAVFFPACLICNYANMLFLGFCDTPREVR